MAEDAEDAEELDELEELEDLEEADDTPPAPHIMDEDEKKIRAIIPPKKEYSPSDDTYFATENFANVDNLFAELLQLGSEVDMHSSLKLKTLEFKIYPVSPLPEPEASETEDETDAFDTVEDLTEEVPTYLSKPDFALTNFGDNVSEDIPELSSVLAIPKGPDDAIVEEDGVYSISEDLEYTNVEQDADFKKLVDSIL